MSRRINNVKWSGVCNIGTYTYVQYKSVNAKCQILDYKKGIHEEIVSQHWIAVGHAMHCRRRGRITFEYVLQINVSPHYHTSKALHQQCSAHFRLRNVLVERTLAINSQKGSF